uniref:Uncharacterized protein n=1 Tax=Candidatus Kentrum sp. FM TaxID=2126340 RepID=A0A450T2B2_9GAMM|nr:MAG: hypothetical protein BECKFM1743C_GA0114222_1027712 [Candidatus Kentron sp. FM]VFJ60901.1 MAG: hypothetical protein BECKFM1743A_GA0114220_1027312 [Candidatus Kentron sp. FM]VFK13147.1 MAG: hypothetical protein BECKFM1743B_GA0114221_1026711 [Candidatus Kentron sp. FM]
MFCKKSALSASICIALLIGGCHHTMHDPELKSRDKPEISEKNLIEESMKFSTSPVIETARRNYGDSNFYVQVKVKDRSGSEQAFKDCVDPKNEKLITKLFEKLRQIGFSSSAQMTLLIKLSGDAELSSAEKVPVLTA